MGLREQMLRVLRGTEAQRIHFSMTGTTGIAISVDGSSFRRVAQAIESDRIHIAEGGVASGWAQYNARNNTFNIGQSSERWSRAYDALLIHESVHASFDLSRSSLPWLDNETAAYIAQGYYLRNSGFSRSRLDELGQPYLGVLIVDSIVRTGSIDRTLVEELQGTLLSSPQYHSYIRTNFEGDG
ncbi:MAG: hypothetical protein WA584_21655 [Pyrinomonadaceae bacterium]